MPRVPGLGRCTVNPQFLCALDFAGRRRRFEFMQESAHLPANDSVPDRDFLGQLDPRMNADTIEQAQTALAPVRKIERGKHPRNDERPSCLHLALSARVDVVGDWNDGMRTPTGSETSHAGAAPIPIWLPDGAARTWRTGFSAGRGSRLSRAISGRAQRERAKSI